MIIAFDAKRAFHNRSGLGNYSRQLIDRVRLRFPEWRIVLYSGGKDWELMPVEWPQDPSIHMVHERGAFFRSFGVTNDLKYRGAHVYHGLSNELPFTIGSFAGRKIVTIHDVIFRHRPADYRWPDRMMYHLKTTRAVQEADIIIAISERTREDLEKFYPASRGKVRVIYQDADSMFQAEPLPRTIEELKSGAGLPDQFWLFPGASMARKNFSALLEAWQKLPATERMPIVVTGPERSGYGKQVRQLIEKAGGRNVGLHWLGEVPRDTLQGLYHLAGLVLFPSLIEGFGLPVLEALYSGTPVLVSEQLGFNQWHGKGILPADVNSVDGLVRALKHIGEAGATPDIQDLSAVYGAEHNMEALIQCYEGELEL